MAGWLMALGALLLVVLAGLLIARWRLDRAMERTWGELRVPAAGSVFDPASVAGLPEPAQRYLRHAIAPGTPLARSVVLQMQGRIGLKPGAPKLVLHARQILALPGGLIWAATVGSGLRHISGYDCYARRAGAMRWYLWRVVPLVRATGPDFTRSAAGRVALEAVLWLPAALLPENGARWEAVDAHRVRVHLDIDGEALAPLLTVSDQGRLERVEMLRWDPQGLSGTPEYVRWVGEGFDEEGHFGGYTVPVVGRAIARAGTPQANPFFEFRITAAHYR